jgi:predicted DsbA family dithiol-disulfide isomerase
VALGHANYLEALNIADIGILTEIASRYGFAPDEAQAIASDPVRHAEIAEASHWAARQGISGVPFFIFASSFALSGAQPQEVFEKAFETVITEAA